MLRVLRLFESVQVNKKVLGHPDKPFLYERCSQSLAFYAVVFLLLIELLSVNVFDQRFLETPCYRHSYILEWLR